MSTYSNILRPNGAHIAQLTCWLQNGSKNPNFDVFVLSDKGRRRTFLNPNLKVTQQVTLNPGTIYNLPGIFLDERHDRNGVCIDEHVISEWTEESVILTIEKALSHPLFSGGADIRI
jgi:hypothetical protein